jgi:hypothetical protein
MAWQWLASVWRRSSEVYARVLENGVIGKLLTPQFQHDSLKDLWIDGPMAHLVRVVCNSFRVSMLP